VTRSGFRMKSLLAALVAAFVLLVPASASAQSLKSALDRDLGRALTKVGTLDLASVAIRGFTVKGIREVRAGTASFTATARGRTVARGSARFDGRGKGKVRLRLTKAGKGLLAGATSITLTVKAKFKPSSGRSVSASDKVTLSRAPAPTPPIPTNVKRLYSQTFDKRAPWPGLSTQCAHPVQWASENGDGYAHFEVRPGEPTVAGHERCEVSHGGFNNSLPPGEYWYRARQRAGAGFPHDYHSDHWANVLQWHEDEPPPGKDTGPVDAAVFVNSGPSERMLIEGDHLDYIQADVFDIHTWHDFVVHGVWTDKSNGYIEWWLDGVYVGRSDGVTSETGGRHFWKGGIERATELNSLQSADISSIEIYRGR
jgi:Polysaccharide lyase